MENGEGREVMDELRERRWAGRERPRIASLMARIDAGDQEAHGELVRRIQEDCRILASEDKANLAGVAWDWLKARAEDAKRAKEYAKREDVEEEAPRRWAGLRVRVTHIAGAGLTRPVQVVGRLAGITDRGLYVLTDDIEEEGRRGSTKASDIVRRVKAERLIGWPSLLTVQPLPVREVYAIEENVRAHEEAVLHEQEADVE